MDRHPGRQSLPRRRVSRRGSGARPALHVLRRRQRRAAAHGGGGDGRQGTSSMKIALGNRRQLLLWGGLTVILVLALVRMQKRPEASPTPAVARSGAVTPLPGDEERAPSSRPRGGREEKKV